MLRFAVIALVLAMLLQPLGDLVVGAMELGYEAREVNTRLTVAASGSGAEIVPASEYAATREE